MYRKLAYCPEVKEKLEPKPKQFHFSDASLARAVYFACLLAVLTGITAEAIIKRNPNSTLGLVLWCISFGTILLITLFSVIFVMGIPSLGTPGSTSQ